MLRRKLNAAAVVVLTVTGVIMVPSPALAALDVRQVTVTSAVNGDDIKSISAPCPANTKVIGGGADLSGPGDKIHLIGMYPDEESNSFVALGREHVATNSAWSVTAMAACAQPSGWDIVEEEVTWSSVSPKSKTVLCGAGQKALGVGARVAAPSTSKLILTSVRTTGTGNGADVEAMEMTGGYDGDWKLRVVVVCATTPAGWALAPLSPVQPGVYWAQTACPSPKRLTTAAAFIDSSLGEIYLREVALLPDDEVLPKPVSVAAAVWWVGDPDHDWYVRASGICVS